MKYFYAIFTFILCWSTAPLFGMEGNARKALFEELYQLRQQKVKEQKQVIEYMQTAADLGTTKNDPAAFAYTYAEWKINNHGSTDQYRNFLTQRIKNFSAIANNHKANVATLQGKIDSIEHQLDLSPKDLRRKENRLID